MLQQVGRHALPVSIRRGLRDQCRSVASTWGRRWHRIRHRLGHADLRSALDGLWSADGPGARCLLVHSSLSRCGWIRGGAATVIASLTESCRTLALPTHTYSCYPTRPDEAGPVYDPRRTPSSVGLITDTFWRMPGVVRSIHPTHSIAARGQMAQSLCHGHERCATPCGAASPYVRLIEADASVLLFGATLDAYTLFHTAEDAAACPYLYSRDVHHLRAADDTGILHEMRTRRHDMHVKRCFEQMDVVLAAEGLLRRGRLGSGEVLYVASSRAVHQFVLDRLTSDPFYLIAPAARAAQEAAAARR